MDIHSLIKRRRDIGKWFLRWKFYVLAGIIAIITILYLVGATEFQPKWVSVGMIVLGLVFILTQQLQDARLFSYYQPNTIPNLIKSFPTGKPKTLSIQSASHVHTADNVHLVAHLPDKATMEDKLNDLLKQVSSIQSELGELDNRISDVARSSERTSKDIKVEINNVNKSLQTLVAGHTVGAYDINLAGIIITLCGTIIQAL